MKKYSSKLNLHIQWATATTAKHVTKNFFKGVQYEICHYLFIILYVYIHITETCNL